MARERSARIRGAVSALRSLPDNWYGRAWSGPRTSRKRPRTAARGCGELIPHHRKDSMVAGGRWRSTATSAKIAGFHLSELHPLANVGAISPKISQGGRPAGTIAGVLEYQPRRMLDKKRRSRFRTSEALMARREPYTEGIAPAGGCFLTAGCDVQSDRLEVEIVAWGKDYESWSVAFYVLPWRHRSAGRLATPR